MATITVPLAHLLPSPDGETINPADAAWLATQVGTDLATSNDERLFPAQGDGLLTVLADYAPEHASQFVLLAVDGDNATIDAD